MVYGGGAGGARSAQAAGGAPGSGYASQDPRVGPPLSINFHGRQLQIGKPPSVKQWAFFNRAEKEQLYGGSKSGGKSRALCAKLIMLAVEFPGNQLGLFRKDLTDLKGSTLVTWDLMLPKELLLQHHKTDHYYLIRSRDERYPTKLWYGGLGEIADFEAAKGKEYGAFAIDEPSEIPDQQAYLQMIGQLRWTLPDGYGKFDPQYGVWRPPYMALLGSNPEPGWLEDHFGHLIDHATKECPIISDDQDRVYIMALPSDNPYNPPDWEAMMRAQADIPKSWIQKYLDGSWKASEGKVFKELDDVHYIPCPPDEFLRKLTLIAALDHADTGITCFSIDGIDAAGNIFALASYYAKNKLVSVHAKAIRDLCDAWVRLCGKEEIARARTSGNGSIHWSIGGFDYVLIDPSTQNKTQQGVNQLWSIQDLYLREGIPTSSAFNAIESGIKLMEEYIHVKPAKIHPLRQLVGSPSYFIVKELNRDGVKELEGWKRTITVNKTIRYVGPDHWIDTQRYIIHSRPVPPEFHVDKFINMTTHGRMAQRALDKWGRTFGNAPDPNQWFPGGTTKGNEYLGKPN